jgi:hypothetical protein
VGTRVRDKEKAPKVIFRYTYELNFEDEISCYKGRI